MSDTAKKQSLYNSCSAASINKRQGGKLREICGDLEGPGSHHTEGTAGLCILRQSPEGGLQRLHADKNARHGCHLGLRGIICMLRTETCSRAWHSHSRDIGASKPSATGREIILWRTNSFRRLRTPIGGKRPSRTLQRNCRAHTVEHSGDPQHEKEKHTPVLFNVIARLRGGLTATACFRESVLLAEGQPRACFELRRGETGLAALVMLA